jgi:hypothetical protein
MKVTMIGTGYVGLVTGTCLAEVGNDVLCLDVDARKIDVLNEGGVPIHEPGLAAMIARNVAAGRLHFTTDLDAAVAHGVLQFIAVGTPPDEDGSADMKYVWGLRAVGTTRMTESRSSSTSPRCRSAPWIGCARRSARNCEARLRHAVCRRRIRIPERRRWSGIARPDPRGDRRRDERAIAGCARSRAVPAQSRAAARDGRAIAELTNTRRTRCSPHGFRS